MEMKIQVMMCGHCEMVHLVVDDGSEQKSFPIPDDIWAALFRDVSNMQALRDTAATPTVNPAHVH